MSPTWYTFAQADKEFKTFKVTVTINKNENTLEMLEAEVCHNDEEGLDSIKNSWYDHRNTYRWKGLFNDKEIMYTYNSDTHDGEIRGEIPDRNILEDYLFLACYRNGIGIPGHLIRFTGDENTRAKVKAVMNDYSYEEYYDDLEPHVLGYNVNTFHPQTVAERKAIKECNPSHIKITQPDYKQLYEEQLEKMEQLNFDIKQSIEVAECDLFMKNLLLKGEHQGTMKIDDLTLKQSQHVLKFRKEQGVYKLRNKAQCYERLSKKGDHVTCEELIKAEKAFVEETIGRQKKKMDTLTKQLILPPPPLG